MLQSNPVTLIFWPLQGSLRLIGYPDASYRNNADKSSQRGQCIFLAEPRIRGQTHTYGSLIDYESSKIKRTTMSTTVSELYAFMKCYGTAQFLRGLWCDISAEVAEIHMRTDANNLVTTASTTHLPEQKETVHMIQMMRKEACSGGIDDLAHVKTEYMLADCFTKSNAKSENIEEAVKTGRLPFVDAHPPFRTLLQHKAYFVEWSFFNLKKTKEPIQTVLGINLATELASMLGQNPRTPLLDNSHVLLQDTVEHDADNRVICYSRRNPKRGPVVPRTRDLPPGLSLFQLKPVRISNCQFTATNTTTLTDKWNDPFNFDLPAWTGTTYFYY